MAAAYISYHEAKRIIDQKGECLEDYRDGQCWEIVHGVKLGYRERRWFLLYFTQWRRNVMGLLSINMMELRAREERRIREEQRNG